MKNNTPAVLVDLYADLTLAFDRFEKGFGLTFTGVPMKANTVASASDASSDEFIVVVIPDLARVTPAVHCANPITPPQLK